MKLAKSLGSAPTANQNASSCEQMPPFTRVVKYQNSSTSNLFKELKNTLIFR
jgi:hypothetical protein